MLEKIKQPHLEDRKTPLGLLHVWWQRLARIDPPWDASQPPQLEEIEQVLLDLGLEPEEIDVFFHRRLLFCCVGLTIYIYVCIYIVCMYICIGVLCLRVERR